MATSIDIGSTEVKLIELGEVNDSPVVNKIHSKRTWDDMNTFDPEKLEKANWVGCLKDICNDMKIIPKKVKSLNTAISGKNIPIQRFWSSLRLCAFLGGRRYIF